MSKWSPISTTVQTRKRVASFRQEMTRQHYLGLRTAPPVRGASVTYDDLINYLIDHYESHLARAKKQTRGRQPRTRPSESRPRGRLRRCERLWAEHYLPTEVSSGKC